MMSADPDQARGPRGGLDQAQLAVVADAVAMAPSLLGGRPWQLRTAGDRLELHAGAGRCEPVVDPIGRARTISCGAAVRNVELAVGRLGFRPQVLEFPDPSNRLHVATVLVAAGPPGHTAAATDDRLYRAIRRRHSYRGPFSGRPVPPASAVRLRAAGQGAGVSTVPIAGDALATVATVLAAARELQRADPRYRAWCDADGTACGAPPGAGEAALADYLSRGRLALVMTVDDRPVDWLHAGRAVQNQWLTAVSLGLVGSVIELVLEAPGVRGALVERLELAGYPQLFLRVGRRPPDGSAGRTGSGRPAERFRGHSGR